MSENKSQPTGSIIGLLLIGGAGAAVYHWITKGTAPTPQAMMAAPDTSMTGFLAAALGASWLPKVPFIGPQVTRLLSFLVSLFTSGQKILDVAGVTQLIASIRAMIVARKIDVAALLAAFQGVDKTALLALIAQLLAIGGKVGVIYDTTMPRPVSGTGAGITLDDNTVLIVF